MHKNQKVEFPKSSKEQLLGKNTRSFSSHAKSSMMPLCLCTYYKALYRSRNRWKQLAWLPPKVTESTTNTSKAH